MSSEEQRARAIALSRARRRRAQAEGGQAEQVPLGQQFNQALAANQGAEFALPQRGDFAAAGQLAATMGSSMVAEPLAGLAGIATTAVAGPEAGAGVVQEVKDRFTVPMGQEGLEAVRSGIEGIPEPILNKLVQFGRKYTDFADMTAQAFGPAAGAAVKTAPHAAMMLLGAKGATQVLRRSNSSLMMNKGTIAKELKNLAPSVDELKAASSALFKEIDNAGVTLNPRATLQLGAKAKRALTSVTGAQKRRAPAIWREVDDIAEAVSGGRGYPVDELVRMRNQLATIAGNKMDNQSVAAHQVREALDEVLDGLTMNNLSGAKAANVGHQLKTARELWRRGKRGEVLEAAMDKAKDYASGYENGIRRQFQQVKNSKDYKYFTADEKKLIEETIRGGFTTNTLRGMGKLGIGDGQSSAITATSIGMAGGYAAAGPAGMVAVPIIGATSRRLAMRLTGNNARFALDVVKSGRNAQKIVAAYMANTPAGKRIPSELSELLMNPQIDLNGLKTAGNSLISQAKLEALANRARIVQGLAAQASGSQSSAQQ